MDLAIADLDAVVGHWCKERHHIDGASISILVGGHYGQTGKQGLQRILPQSAGP